jgi:hypothetical protein
MREAAERESTIGENLDAERRLLKEIQRLTGIVLPRLQWIGNVQGAELERLQPVAARLLQEEQNPVSRGILYAAFGTRAKEDYFERLIAWHRQETGDHGLQCIERCLIVRAGKTNRQRLCDCLLLQPGKIKFDGLRFLLRQSKTDEDLLARIRDAYADCEYDLELLSVIAAQHEADYARIVGGGALSDRLTARQCCALLAFQLPRNEYGFRRPSLVPFYARILQNTTAQPAHLVATLRRFCEELGFGGDVLPGIDSAALALRTHECVPLTIAVGESAGLTRAVVLSLLPADERSAVAMRRHGANCRPRGGPVEQYSLSLIEAPIPPAWNLFPKRLLPADHPLRFVRPD